MTEHFVKMDIEDPRAAAIAEVMANKTCKKILALLAERNELSESDIAQALGAPLNTVGYNMKKLVVSGLVEKTKKFFWSVKGKRIPTYKLSRREIVISPRRLVAPQVLSFLAIGIVAVILAIALLASDREAISESYNNNNDSLRYFASAEEFSDFVEQYGTTNNKGGVLMVDSVTSSASTSEKSGVGAGDYSGTNVQVTGVDELDSVKNDGKYIYTVVGQSVVIVNAYPAESMHVVGNILVNGSINGIFVQNDKLVVVSSVYVPLPMLEGAVEKTIGAFMPCLGCGGNTETRIAIYDIRDKSRPAIIKDYEFTGNYQEARLTSDGFVYVISLQSLSRGVGNPQYRINGILNEIPAQDIAYVPNQQQYVFTSVVGVSLKDDRQVHKVYLTRAGSTIYVSRDNIYLTSWKYLSEEELYRAAASEIVLPLLSGQSRTDVQLILDSDSRFDYTDWEEVLQIIGGYSANLSGEEREKFDSQFKEEFLSWQDNFVKKREMTLVHRISFDKDKISYESFGEVPGRVLNQFSLDENEGFLRIATTTANSQNVKSLNNLYVLDRDMRIVGSVEDLSPGEQIYAVRFFGDRVYVVTFRSIDPFYVIDLENPREPKVLGYLKIPGYSNYLHPYDSTHIIGIGKDVKVGNEQFAYYQGLKISMFDVSDVVNPVEVAHLGIGDRGSDSLVLQDHKALLFSSERNLMVMPVLLAEVNKSAYGDYYNPDSAYGTPVWQGAYVLNVTTNNIEVRGKITHFKEDTNEYWRWYDLQSSVHRSLYIGETLYTLSGGQIQAHDLQSLEFQGEVKLPYMMQEYREF